ncbi:hypothetical protein NDU88_003985 [Pleurodeles waltl]|uniref:Uncharacterized protein n=1 Tax=Pleurodeles waltl TaxID=8319 RepID=A0AAV7QDK2_PLEWA|nr:hypothetical protein NDU88_003985 [Pleurodeles waltl]
MAASCPTGTRGSEREDTPLRNPDIRVPVTEMRSVGPWRAEEDTRNQAEEDDPGDPTEETDARGEEKAETGERGEQQGEEPHTERSYLEQLTPEGSPDEGKRNPETRHRHLPGGTSSHYTNPLQGVKNKATTYLTFFPFPASLETAFPHENFGGTPEDLKERRRRERYIEKEEIKKTDREDL